MLEVDALCHTKSSSNLRHAQETICVLLGIGFCRATLVSDVLQAWNTTANMTCLLVPIVYYVWRGQKVVLAEVTIFCGLRLTCKESTLRFLACFQDLRCIL